MDIFVEQIIPESGLTLGEIGDWRPITLLSKIYKLISGVIENRLQKLLQKLISPSHKAY